MWVCDVLQLESATFGSEIVAVRIAAEMVKGLRCKLRMVGAPMDGSADAFCDNESVVKNAGVGLRVH